MAAFDNILLKSKQLGQVTIEMFISEPEKEENLLSVRFRSYKNRDNKNKHFKRFSEIVGMRGR